MIIQIDTREKDRAIKKIIAEFDRQGIKYISSKMFVGDYCDLSNPLVIIDRKQNIAELAQNATSQHDRFKRELLRLDEIGGKMYILVEQDKIDGVKIQSLDDVMMWKPRFGKIIGLQIYRILSAWQHKHNIEYVFCSKANTGKEIIRLLEDSK
jgi:hypothetical protein